MENKEFILNIIKLYQEARISKFQDFKIRRGRSRSVSSDAEDMFALFLSKKIDCDCIYVDQPISIDGRGVHFYPDIVIIKNNKITSFCDLKMDLGWKRDGLYSFCQKYKEYLALIKDKDCKIRDGITKEDKHYNISSTASFNVVIVSDQNINPKTLKNHLENIKKLGGDVEIYILSKKEHPNTYGYTKEKLIKKIEINDADFNRLINKLNN